MACASFGAPFASFCNETCRQRCIWIKPAAISFLFIWIDSSQQCRWFHAQRYFRHSIWHGGARSWATRSSASNTPCRRPTHRRLRRLPAGSRRCGRVHDPPGPHSKMGPALLACARRAAAATNQRASAFFLHAYQRSSSRKASTEEMSAKRRPALRSYAAQLCQPSAGRAGISRASNDTAL